MFNVNKDLKFAVQAVRLIKGGKGGAVVTVSLHGLERENGAASRVEPSDDNAITAIDVEVDAIVQPEGHIDNLNLYVNGAKAYLVDRMKDAVYGLEATIAGRR